MLLINSLTNDAQQQFVLDGIPGVQVSVLLRFMPRIQSWMMNLSYGETVINGVAVISSPNLLRQWRNILPFGIACTNIYGIDPYTLTDFSSGNSSLYLLDSDDIILVEEAIFS